MRHLNAAGRKTRLRSGGRTCNGDDVQSATIPIGPATRRTLEQLALRTHSSLQSVLDAAVEAYRRQVFLEQTNQAFAELREDAKAWDEYRREIQQWETAGQDGL